MSAGQPDSKCHMADCLLFEKKKMILIQHSWLVVGWPMLSCGNNNKAVDNGQKMNIDLLQFGSFHTLFVSSLTRINMDI